MAKNANLLSAEDACTCRLTTRENILETTNDCSSTGD